MTDKEKIELIIQDKHLNNTQFCNEVCIAQGTLSHIRSGRTEPSLNILRSIAQAFPDINPAWLFYDEEPMYKNAATPTPKNDEADDTYIDNMSPADTTSDVQLPLFAFSPDDTKQSKGSAANSNASTPIQPAASPRRSSSTNIPVYTALDVQGIVAETIKQQQKPQRKIVEVRIFFDDGTFETFSNT
ncbi:MAG: helix-turn-helix transcriptional regulator [Prevotellaceae bacterium]|nr:helix-turn-helix transcriptional regulator [Prevotellaceae bacterium]